jgi:hypothetical protein
VTRMVLDSGRPMNAMEKLLLKQWGQLLEPDERLLAAQYGRPAGGLVREILWSSPGALTAGVSNVVADAVGQFVGLLGKSVHEEVAGKRGSEGRRRSTEVPFTEIVLAITNRRFLVFEYIRGVVTIKLKLLSAHPPGWLTDITVKPGIVNNGIILTFNDGTSVPLEVTKGIGNPDGLVRALKMLQA